MVSTDEYSEFDLDMHLHPGTLLGTPFVTSEDGVRDFIRSNFSAGSTESDEELEQAIDRLLELYPDNPALGSPFNTGNETFGLPKEYKRISAMG